MPMCGPRICQWPVPACCALPELNCCSVIQGFAAGRNAQSLWSELRSFTLLRFACRRHLHTTYKAQIPATTGIAIGPVYFVRVAFDMIIRAEHCQSGFGRYVLFNGALVGCTALLIHSIADLAAEMKRRETPTVSAELSRVEKFELAAAVDAQARRIAVVRTIVARNIPDVPVQVLAVQIDRAEGVKIKPLKATRSAARLAQVSKRKRKSPSHWPGDLPDSVLTTAYFETGYETPSRPGKRRVVAESSRDIINRSLGVLVALRN
jgi:hypothetical protein